MATSTSSITHIGEMSTPEINTCVVSRSMLLSAFNENAALSVDVFFRAVVGALAFWLVGYVLPVVPGLEFYAALSGSIAVLYVANLADVSGIRDTIISIVPALMVWGILMFDVQSAALIGLTLFTHLLMAFFAGFSKVSGSLRDLALWPVMFGGVGVTLAAYVEQFLN